MARRSIEKFEERLILRIAAEESRLAELNRALDIQQVRIQALKSALEELQMAPDEKGVEP